MTFYFFVRLHKNQKMEEQKLGQTEYEEVLLDNLSKVVVNRSFIKQNKQFWDNLVFKMFEEYYFSMEFVSIKKQARLLEIYLHCMFSYKPALKLPEDVLELDD